MRFLLIKDGVVQNEIIADAEFVDAYYSDYVAVESNGEPGSPGVGWKHDGKSFSPPDPVDKTDQDLIREKEDDLSFGKILVIEIAIMNDKRKLSTDDRAMFAKLFGEVQGFLLSGEFEAALKYMTLIPTDKVVMTQEIIDDLRAKIQDRVTMNGGA